MQHGDEASPSIILASRALLVKMLITLEPYGISASNFVYLCILTLSSHCHAKRWRGFVEHHFGRLSSLSENAHNSWTPSYIYFKFCILMYLNIVQQLPCKTVTRLCQASFWPVKLIYIISTTGCAYYCQLINVSNPKSYSWIHGFILKQCFSPISG